MTLDMQMRRRRRRRWECSHHSRTADIIYWSTTENWAPDTGLYAVAFYR